jgi:hypothetical protein
MEKKNPKTISMKRLDVYQKKKSHNGLDTDLSIYEPLPFYDYSLFNDNYGKHLKNIP